MRNMKYLSAVLIALILVVSILPGPALAADGTVTITDGDGNYIEFAPGTTYSDTSLFPNFEGVMPGDEIDEKITVTNSASDCDYVKIYVTAKPHDEQENPLQPAVKGEGDNQETVASMEDFLKQLSMTVKKGDETIYSGDPKGSPGNNVFLGTLEEGESVTLTVHLSVPISLDNKYSNRRGEVDWVFTVEKYNIPTVSVDLEVVNTPKDGSAYTPGEEIHYQITVTNNSDESITNITVTDPLLGIEIPLVDENGDPLILAPGESYVVPNDENGENYFPYTVTNTDASAGKVHNEVTVTAYSIDPDYKEELTDTDSVDSPAAKKGGDQPDTGYRSYVMLFVSLLFLALVICLIAVRKLKRNVS